MRLRRAGRLSSRSSSSLLVPKRFVKRCCELVHSFVQSPSHLYRYIYRVLKIYLTEWTVWQRTIRPFAISPGEPAALQQILPWKLQAKCKTWCVKLCDAKLHWRSLVALPCWSAQANHCSSEVTFGPWAAGVCGDNDAFDLHEYASG